MAQSHRDDDYKDKAWDRAGLDILREKAKLMTELRQNLITAGTEKERPLYAEMAHGIQVTRMPEDPLALRISIGEAHIEGDSSYLVFRGRPSDILRLLHQAIAAMEKVHAGHPERKP